MSVLTFLSSAKISCEACIEQNCDQIQRRGPLGPRCLTVVGFLRTTDYN
jgi:hypothetical protein